ncbi:phosphoribosylformylglycinamidine synthase [Candidatus Nomurabacteria bacterium RIFCSPLOWO2_01_FULL_39_18]|uniref:Phosphoribosylformylglycinamidine synthase subunit PurL n=1 Tax=Candidatus Nomurabacteria bacterium RIFCSPHIGHO2_01_FULL_40_24b TaxID=1801739 RepID=A0A1F6V6H9_9BACT|nr:MAG: phosphoribosylformylglycinamidine synthase [Candidatus Nomurabacteria bacterium RIFCSPHIGHO2_01_FULL_40_24b]OGI89223.1 MAG: phosphoribosylformylglycinamidine synthase [Candidatus Nomurabacteria bacterium RIFCSPLOWO2_01_FULL_39_18]
MISRIFVMLKNGATRADSYLIDSKFLKKELIKLAEALTNPILENFSINNLEVLPPNGGKTSKFTYAIEIGFKPGVTDNVGHTVEEIARDLLGVKKNPDFHVYTSKIVFISLSKKDAEKYALTLYNPLIEKSLIVPVKNKKISLPKKVPKVVLKKRKPVINVSLKVSDEELIKIGKEGIKDGDGTRRGPLALDLASMKTIQGYFKKLKRSPTDIELESLAQTWSEHCKHTIFANPIDNIKDGLYKTYIKGATNLIRKQKGKNDFCVSVFSDNSGGIIFDKDYLITHKVETHNSPSALDPFGGAITGIGGVNRDAIGFGLGAKPVANTYGFCLAPPDEKRKLFRDKDRTQALLPAKRIMEGVIKGINVGGNCSGIPTLSGFIKFDDRFRGKPLVFAGTVGLIPRKNGSKLLHEKKARVGDYIVMVGGKVGLDGIHGATFSSVTLDSTSPATAVQIGDPITQKKLSDAIVKEARGLNLYNSITDDGAGGLSCSVAEMAKECGGAKVMLEKVPLKYPGLRPWEIWISESQERMTLSVPKKKWKKFNELMKSRGVEATVIGKFTNSGNCVVNYKGKKIMDLDMEFLHNGLPKQHLTTIPYLQNNKEPQIPKNSSLTKTLENLLGNNNISGFSYISQQYDHEVQASSVLKPLSGRGRINTDAQVFRPVLSSEKGVILSTGVYPSYGDINTYYMAACALDTAIRNIIASGGSLSNLAILDNFCWCSSYDKTRLAQLVDAVKACYDYGVGYGTPFISGKDSMFNDFRGYDEKGNPIAISIPPTLLISAIGVVPDIYKIISPEFKNVGDVIYLLGKTDDELGGSEYYKSLKAVGNDVPKVNLEKNLKTYLALERAIQKELVASSISVTSGGLAIALAKTCVGGMLGCNISVRGMPGSSKSADAKLFSESQGRILVSISPQNISAFEKIIKNIPYAKMGKVVKDGKFTITDKTKIVKTDVKKLYKIYHRFSEKMK